VAAYYLDTSALVKRYALEIGTAWVRALTDPSAGNDLFTVRIAGPELIAALARKVRTGELAPTDASRASANFRLDWAGDFQVIEVNEQVALRAMDLAETHGLRGYDAVHLAAALEVNARRLRFALAPLTFVSADAQQVLVAIRVGLPAANPNDHP
jgi:predicted nucleic acid-binding protein